MKSTFDDVLQDLDDQQAEADRLRQQLSFASSTLLKANEEHSAHLRRMANDEKTRAASERADLLKQVSDLFQTHGEKQDKRLDAAVSEMQAYVAAANQSFEKERSSYDSGVDLWSSKGHQIRNSLLSSRESIKQRIRGDWNTANEHTTSISETTRSVHAETIRIVDSQMANMDEQLSALDEILAWVRSQNSSHHDAHVQSLARLGNTVKQSYTSIGNHLNESTDRARAFSKDLNGCAANIVGVVEGLDNNVRKPLMGLRSDIGATGLTEYTVTGATPQKTSYSYPTALPRTQAHKRLVARFRGEPLTESPKKSSPRGRIPLEVPELGSPDGLAAPPMVSPSKVAIFADFVESNDVPEGIISPPTTHNIMFQPATVPSKSTERGLREADKNITTTEQGPRPVHKSSSEDGQPPVKRQNTGDELFSKSVGAGPKPPKKVIGAVAEGRENMPLAASAGGGRVLRARRS